MFRQKSAGSHREIPQKPSLSAGLLRIDTAHRKKLSEGPRLDSVQSKLKMGSI